MNQRSFLGAAAAIAAAAPGSRIAAAVSTARATDICGCEPIIAQSSRGEQAARAEAFRDLSSGLKITNLKVFGVSLTPESDRPYVFVKLETNQGLVGWGEGTLEGKAGRDGLREDFRDFVIGEDPMQVEHIWQSMYVHSFYRAGPVIGSAISGIDQALWDIRGKALGMPVYKLLGGPDDTGGVRGYYHAENARRTSSWHSCAKPPSSRASRASRSDPRGIRVDRDPCQDRSRREAMQLIRENLGADIDIAVDFHAKTSPSVASVIIKEVEPLNLLFIEEPCPPENVQAMARIARRSTTPIATGERLVASYGCRELIEMGVVDILQTDINHVGGVTGLWKVAAMANVSGSPWRRTPARGRSADWPPSTWMRPCPTFWSRRSAAS